MAASSKLLLGTYPLRKSSQTFSFQSIAGSKVLINNQRHASDSQTKASGDLNDPKYAKWAEKPHPEKPVKYHIDKLSPEPVKGKIFEKQPIRVQLEAGKKYFFCTCGYSKNQPFCDSSHKAPNFVSTRPHHIRYRPLPFTVEETEEYWLCMCKQSNNRPFCDGTHKREDLQFAKVS